MNLRLTGSFVNSLICKYIFVDCSFHCRRCAFCSLPVFVFISCKYVFISTWVCAYCIVRVCAFNRPSRRGRETIHGLCFWKYYSYISCNGQQLSGETAWPIERPYEYLPYYHVYPVIFTACAAVTRLFGILALHKDASFYEFITSTWLCECIHSYIDVYTYSYISMLANK